jgi:hypothetical protein
MKCIMYACIAVRWLSFSKLRLVRGVGVLTLYFYVVTSSTFGLIAQMYERN